MSSFHGCASLAIVVRSLSSCLPFAIVLRLRLLFARPSGGPCRIYDHNVPGTKAGTWKEGLDCLKCWLNVLLSSYAKVIVWNCDCVERSDCYSNHKNVP